MTMAGYNWQNGNYEPFDTLWSLPDDQRILISTGPWNLSQGDSIILDFVLIASHDSMPLSLEMEYKADKAQLAFNTGFHNVTVIEPNGDEVVSGNTLILYSANSITPNPLLVDFFLVSEHGRDTIALGQSNTGSYNWNTTLFPGGVLNRILTCAYDTMTLGADVSDGYFVINNPGNSPPYLQVLSPKESVNQWGDTIPDTLMRNFDIVWFARDPEFLDLLYINIYFKSQYDADFVPIALNELNDSHFVWNTLPYRNGSGLLVVQTNDEDFMVAETVKVYLLNQISGGSINQISGQNNCVELSVLVHQPEYLTGHTYELEFLEYRRVVQNNNSYPEYIYKITDLNTNSIVLDTYSLKNGYHPVGSGIKITDYSPIIAGYSIKASSNGSYYIPKISWGNFHNDSVRVVIGSYPQDSIILLFPTSSLWWAHRGSCLQLDWVLKSGGGLTLLVTDLDYQDTIPYKPYNHLGTLNPDSAFGWCFGRIPIGPPSDTFCPGYTNLILLCGSGLRLTAGVYPQLGDRWIVYPSQYSPPIKGNVYRFTPINYVAEAQSELTSISFQIFPVPFKEQLTIDYSLLEPKKISIIIYDVLGRKVRSLRHGLEKPGSYRIIWDGLDDRNRGLSAGVYFCRFETEDYKKTQKVIFIK